MYVELCNCNADAPMYFDNDFIRCQYCDGIVIGKRAHEYAKCNNLKKENAPFYVNTKISVYRKKGE